MELRKTTTLPPGDAAQNEQTFNDVISKDHVVFVVTGTGAKAENLVKLADGLAGKPHEPRWVVWAHNHADIANAVAALECGPNPAPSAIDLGFTISLTNKIQDVLRATEPDATTVRVFRAYAAADRNL